MKTHFPLALQYSGNTGRKGLLHVCGSSAYEEKKYYSSKHNLDDGLGVLGHLVLHVLEHRRR